MATRKDALAMRAAIDRLVASGAFGEPFGPPDFLAAIELSELVRAQCPDREDRLSAVVPAMARMFSAALERSGGREKAH